ncbi:hypothetical protein BS17DRAFT_811237 [Gyrodon lividus]|nr:hypothetical protein BS17DRAFT_811237 [Gyrodon lividus]
MHRQEQQFKHIPQWLVAHNASQLPSDAWASQLWDHVWGTSDSLFVRHEITRSFNGNLHNIELPKHCWILQGSQDELDLFSTSSIYFRGDYHRLLCEIISHTEVKDHHGKSRDIDDEEFDGDAEVPNLFTGCKFKSGHPIMLRGCQGIGKSLFLHVLLRLLLQAKQPTLFQMWHCKILLFTHLGVHQLNDVDDNEDGATTLSQLIPNAWCLVDSNSHLIQPSYFIRNSGLTIIEAISPDIERQNWVWEHSRTFVPLCMKPFTVEEAIIVVGFKTMGSLPTECQIKYWFDHYVPSAHIAYAWANQATMYKTHLDMLLDSLQCQRMSLKDVAIDLTLKAVSLHPLLHHIFIYSPTPDLDSMTWKIATPHLVERVLYNSYLSLLQLPAVGAAAEHLQEILFLQDVQTCHSWTLRELQASCKKSNVHWTFNQEDAQGTLDILPVLPPPWVSGTFWVIQYTPETILPRGSGAQFLLYPIHIT